MNCINCPIIEECEANKMTVQQVYTQGGIAITTVAVPTGMEECPLLIVIAKATKELSGIDPEISIT